MTHTEGRIPADAVMQDGIAYMLRTDASGDRFFEVHTYVGKPVAVEISAQIRHGWRTYPVKAIGEQAFYGCAELRSAVIPESVVSIGDWAFSDCCSLTSVAIPKGVTFIGQGAFSRCRFHSVTIPAGVTSIGSNVFCGCHLHDITIPGSVTSIGFKAFTNCFYLRAVTIMPGVRSIGFQSPEKLDE